MKYIRQVTSVFLLSLTFIAGCGGGNYKEKLAAVRPNMSRDELLYIMKEPGVIRNSSIGKNGKLNEKLEYTFITDMLEGNEILFHFVFVDDRLIRWGRGRAK